MDQFKIVNAEIKMCDEAGLDPLIVAEVELEAPDGTHFFFSGAETQGFPSFFKTDVSTIDDQLDVDAETNDELWDMLANCYVAGEDYEEVLTDKDNHWYQAIRYTTYLIRCEAGKDEEFISETKGKYLNEVEVPTIDIEEDLGL